MTSAGSAPFFSVVIPTCDRPVELRTCLARLSPGEQTLQTAHHEVIVTDDSVSGSAQALWEKTFPWVRWTRGPRRGPAANRNHGAAQARGEWLAFVDDDCVPDRDWLQGFLSRIRAEPTLRVCEGRVYADHERQSCYETSPINEHGGNLWSCNFAIRRDTFAALDGFAECFRYAAMEDVELRVRLEKARVPMAFCADAAVMHPWRVERAIWRARMRHRESVLLFNALHPDRAVLGGTRYHMLLRRWGREFWRDLVRFGWAAVPCHLEATASDLADIRAYPSTLPAREVPDTGAV